MKKKIKKHDPRHIGIKNINFSLCDENDKREKKYIKQRLSRGFDDSETWSLRDTFAQFALPRLKRFKEIGATYCHPWALTPKEWEKTIDKMIFSFELIAKDDLEVNIKKEKEIQEGLNLFSKWFMDLWW